MREPCRASTSEAEFIARRLKQAANSDPLTARIISDNPIYVLSECSAEEVNVVGRIRGFAREI